MNKHFENWFGPDPHRAFASGVFSDELDRCGQKSQVSNAWRSNRPRARMFGRTRTLLLKTEDTPNERIREGLGFLEQLDEGDVLVVAGSHKFAYFGELMSRLSVRRGLGGVVIDGLTRDTDYTQTIDLPIFAKGYSPVDIKGRGYVAAVDVPVVIDGITVKPHDWAFGDSDALVFMTDAMLQEVLPQLKKATSQEEEVKRMIDNGCSIEEILSFVNEF